VERVKVAVELATTRAVPGGRGSVVATWVRAASTGEDAFLCPKAEVDALVGLFPATPRAETRDPSFDGAFTVFGAFAGLGDPSVRGLVTDLAPLWCRRASGQLEVVLPPLTTADASRAIDLSLALDREVPPRALRPGPRAPRALGCFFVGALAAAWLGALIIGPLGGTFLPVASASVRAELEDEVCPRRQHLYVSRAAYGPRVSYGVYCGVREGSMSSRADDAMLACGSVIAGATTCLGVLVAFLLLLRRREA
jgi:hypothetical protein